MSRRYQENGFALEMMTAVFTSEARERLRDTLIAAARDDSNVVAAATIGSAALDAEDRWSDIDLALCVEDEASAVAAWTKRMYQVHGAMHHLDVYSGSTRFRVFLLDNTLQVDIAFWSRENFGATGPAFRILFGEAKTKLSPPTPASDELIAYGWLYALHARSSIARGRMWQAEYWISHLRDAVLTLMCVRHGLPHREARGIDRLPADAVLGVEAALVRSLEPDELRRAFGAAMDAYRTEAALADRELAARLGPTLATFGTT